MASANAGLAVPEKILKRSSFTPFSQLSPSNDSKQQVTRESAQNCTQGESGNADGQTTNAVLRTRAYLFRETLSQTKDRSCGNPTAARRALAGLGNTPNTAEPLPASKASDAPAWSKARLI